MKIAGPVPRKIDGESSCPYLIIATCWPAWSGGPLTVTESFVKAVILARNQVEDGSDAGMAAPAEEDEEDEDINCAIGIGRAAAAAAVSFVQPL